MLGVLRWLKFSLFLYQSSFFNQYIMKIQPWVPETSRKLLHNKNIGHRVIPELIQRLHCVTKSSASFPLSPLPFSLFWLFFFLQKLTVTKSLLQIWDAYEGEICPEKEVFLTKLLLSVRKTFPRIPTTDVPTGLIVQDCVKCQSLARGMRLSQWAGTSHDTVPITGAESCTRRYMVGQYSRHLLFLWKKLASQTGNKGFLLVCDKVVKCLT